MRNSGPGGHAELNRFNWPEISNAAVWSNWHSALILIASSMTSAAVPSAGGLFEQFAVTTNDAHGHFALRQGDRQHLVVGIVFNRVSRQDG